MKRSSRPSSPQDPHDGCVGCNEYKALSRRSFVGWSGAALAAAVAPSWLPRVAYADSENSSRDIIVNLFMRGGWDGLSVCVPYTEDSYYSLRPSIAIPRPDSGAEGAALDLDGSFGLPPGLGALLDSYKDGNLLIAHACGSKDPSRSHFDAQYFMESGQGSNQPALFSGWLGRHLATTAPAKPDAVLRGVGIGAGLQQSMIGGPAVPAPDLSNYGLEGNPATEFGRERAIKKMYSGSAVDYLEVSAANTFATIELLEKIDFEGYKPSGGAEYPQNELGQALRSTAALIKADVGVEAVAIDYGGWDTHQNQNPVSGTMNFVMNGFSQAVAAFHQDLFAANRTDFLLTAMSEFGRNAFENGSGGTDHGHGSVMMVLGGAVDGGRVLTLWPGLAQELLYDGQDLDVTIDYRDLLVEILNKRLANPDFRNVFPDPSFTPIDWGIVKS